MRSSTFSHDLYSTVNQICPYFEWDFFSKENPISFYIDGDVVKGIHEKKDNRLKFLWTLESPYFNNNVFEFIKLNLNEVLDTFEMIFTYNENLLSLHNKFKWVPAMGTWIKEPKIHKKTKNVSMIVSNKTFTQEQRRRLEFAKTNQSKIDMFGLAFNKIKSKEEGLNEYMFSVCAENAIYDTYFTEKIMDCFSTGTVPIYMGTKKILKYFDENGILWLDDIDIQTLNRDLYESKIDSIKNNFELSKSFDLPENYIYKNYIKKFLL